MTNLDLWGVPYIKNKVVNAIPYMGNKRKLATKIINAIYQKIGDFDDFYDLFGGGASMSVATLSAGHNVHYNELNTGVCNLLRHIKAGGEIPNKWVSREEFKKHINNDDWYGGLIKTCWSFGNDQASYLFGQDIEELKHQAHEYLLENGYDWTVEIRIKLLAEFKTQKKIIDRFELQQLERLEQLEQLQRLQRLERLQQLEQLQRLEITNKSYNDVEYKNDNTVLYCDIPYNETKSYQESEFSHEDFYKWALAQNVPVFISEYNMPNDFKCISEFIHRSTLSASANNEVVEKLFWNGKRGKK